MGKISYTLFRFIEKRQQKKKQNTQSTWHLTKLITIKRKSISNHNRLCLLKWT